MKDNTYVVITCGLLLGICLLMLIGAAPIQHWIEIPGSDWGAYDTSSNQLFKVRVSDKAFTFNGVIDAGAGIRAHGMINASSQTLTVDTSTARIANAQTMYATGVANALLLNASTVIINGGISQTGIECNINGDGYCSGDFGIKSASPRLGLELRDTINPPTALSSAIVNGSAGNLLLSDDSSGTVGAVFGIALNGSSYDTYIQSRNLGSGNISYNLLLQPLGGYVLIGSITSSISGYDLIVNNGIYSGGTIYGAGTISGQTISDRTPGSPDDAISEIRKMEVVGETIRHETLGLAQAILNIEKTSTVLYDEKSGAEIESYNRKLSDVEIQKIPDGIYIDEQKTTTQETGRDLSILASLLTRAVQQLDERITALEGKQ